MSINLITIEQIAELTGLDKSSLLSLLKKDYILEKGKVICGKKMITEEKLKELKAIKNAK